jgi:predicted adenylyl cyclase CyaB
MGIRCVVEKLRDVFLIDNVRVHLDRVAELGTFLEFEAVLEGGVDDVAGQRQIEGLMEQFGIRADDLLSGSYQEMRGANNQGNRTEPGPPST